jgi:hypothetical protein
VDLRMYSVRRGNSLDDFWFILILVKLDLNL